MSLKFNRDSFKEALKKNKMTYSDLADEIIKRGVHITEPTIKSWFVTKKPSTPDILKINLMAEILNIPIENFVEQDIFLTKNDVKEVKIVGEASCGNPILSCYDDNDTVVFISADLYHDKLYAVRASGDSMFPEIEDGDALVCDPTAKLINGDLVHYILFGESAVKVYIYNEEKETLIFKPINQAPFFQTKYIPKSDIGFNEIKLAKVVQIIKSVTNNRARRLRLVGM